MCAAIYACKFDKKYLEGIGRLPGYERVPLYDIRVHSDRIISMKDLGKLGVTLSGFSCEIDVSSEAIAQETLTIGRQASASGEVAYTYNYSGVVNPPELALASFLIRSDEADVAVWASDYHRMPWEWLKSLGRYLGWTVGEPDGDTVELLFGNEGYRAELIVQRDLFRGARFVVPAAIANSIMERCNSARELGTYSSTFGIEIEGDDVSVEEVYNWLSGIPLPNLPSVSLRLKAVALESIYEVHNAFPRAEFSVVVGGLLVGREDYACFELNISRRGIAMHVILSDPELRAGVETKLGMKLRLIKSD